MLFLKEVLARIAAIANVLFAKIARSRLILFVIVLVIAVVFPKIVAEATKSLLVAELIRWLVDRITRG
jgi:hypothetical protein